VTTAPPSGSRSTPGALGGSSWRPSRPTLWSGAGLVFAGGTLGTLARYAVSRAIPAQHGWPLATLTVNLTGAFALAFLLEAITRTGSESRVLRRLRLLLGSGVISGYTTYSTLAVEAQCLLATGRTATAFGYVALTLVGGLTAAVLGYLLAVRARAGHPAIVPEAEEDDR